MNIQNHQDYGLTTESLSGISGLGSDRLDDSVPDFTGVISRSERSEGVHLRLIVHRDRSDWVENIRSKMAVSEEKFKPKSKKNLPSIDASGQEILELIKLQAVKA